MTPVRHYTKYANRRLYDNRHHCYVTLKDIHAVVREGHDILVTTKATREDITKRVLTQAAMEIAPDALTFDVLYRALRA